MLRLAPSPIWKRLAVSAAGPRAVIVGGRGGPQSALAGAAGLGVRSLATKGPEPQLDTSLCMLCIRGTDFSGRQD